MAYIDVTGSVGIVDLATREAVNVPYAAEAPPLWLPDGGAVLLTGTGGDGPPNGPTFDAPVAPLEPERGDGAVVVLERDGRATIESGFGSGVVAAATALDGRIAYMRADGSLRISATANDRGSGVPALRGERVTAIAFAPGEDAIVVVLATGDDSDASLSGRIERVMLATDERDVLANHGWRARWLP